MNKSAGHQQVHMHIDTTHDTHLELALIVSSR